MMNSLLFALAALSGGAVIAWIGQGFLQDHTIALAVTVLIGLVFLAGLTELWLFRRATGSLRRALASIPADLPQLGDWLGKLHPSLQGAVRQRIEGTRQGLPAPVLTPFLTGLLVMLGMLGTFLGMVVTLNGTAFALEATRDLEAIRNALAAPIKGLGLAFGTSVAGVAASALLGLVSVLSRRERLQVSMQLDRAIHAELSAFSANRQRQDVIHAMQLQANALPAVVTQLQNLASQMAQMHEQMGERQNQEQQRFHASVQGMYGELALSVARTLQDSLGNSARLAGEAIAPLIERAMSTVVEQSQTTHERLLAATRERLDGFADALTSRSETIAAGWERGLERHATANSQLLEGLAQSLHGFDQIQQQKMDSWLCRVEQVFSSLQQRQEQQSGQWLEGLDQALRGFTERQDSGNARLTTTLGDTLGAFSAAQQHQGEQQLTQFGDALGAFSASQQYQGEQQLAQFGNALERFVSGQDQQGREWLNRLEQGLAGFNSARQQGDDALLERLDTALTGLSQRLEDSASQQLSQWENTLSGFAGEQRQTSQQQLQTLVDTLETQQQRQQQAASTLLEQLDTTLATLAATQQQHAGQQQAGWTQALADFRQQQAQHGSDLLQQIAMQASRQQAELAEREQAGLERVQTAFDTLTQTLQQAWQQHSTQAMTREQQLLEGLSAATRDIAIHTRAGADSLLNDMQQVLKASADLIEARASNETQWTQEQSSRIEQLTHSITSALQQLRDEESARGSAAIERLAELENRVAGHLATLGSTLETPMARLIESASEAPRAAAEVITALRQQLTENLARDNALLDERNRIMAELDGLLQAFNATSEQQRNAIESLVSASSDMLAHIGDNFTRQVQEETDKLGGMAADITSSAIDVASLGETLNNTVTVFGAGSEKLLAHLEKLEAALEKSNTRSDEQLAYYVSQAREIIDLSMLSQREIFAELRQLNAHQGGGSKA